MTYEINYEELMKDVGTSKNIEQIIIAQAECIRAIFYLLKVSKFQIDEDLYSSLDASGKKYFIGKK